MSWARESDLPVGPMLPATKTCLGALSATVLAILAAAQANSAALSCIPYAAWEILEALKELVVMMSAPASTYSEWLTSEIFSVKGYSFLTEAWARCSSATPFQATARNST